MSTLTYSSQLKQHITFTIRDNHNVCVRVSTVLHDHQSNSDLFPSIPERVSKSNLLFDTLVDTAKTIREIMAMHPDTLSPDHRDVIATMRDLNKSTAADMFGLPDLEENWDERIEKVEPLLIWFGGFEDILRLAIEMNGSLRGVLRKRREKETAEKEAAQEKAPDKKAAGKKAAGKKAAGKKGAGKEGAGKKGAGKKAAGEKAAQ